MVKALNSEKLRRVVPVTAVNWKQIREKHKLRPLIGQDRALEAFEFGIGNKSGGFNIYVSGYPGSGKLRAVNHFLEERAKFETSPGDWCYVNNFKDAYYPKKLRLPQGNAEIFKNEINKLIEEAQKALINAFESTEYANKRQEIIDEFQQRETDLFKNIHKKAKANNFTIRRTPIEIIILPTDENGKPVSDKNFLKLPKKKQKEIIGK
ncbi:MAG: AAA family ATPase, partial [Flavobacteriaceae bacterium]|nr:AAA family ATPase [Flavobacteriaceae bacterium]